MATTLKPWSPKTINKRQLRAIQMASWGITAPEIADLLGYHLAHLYRLLATDEAQEVKSAFEARIESTIENTVRDLVPQALNGVGASG